MASRLRWAVPTQALCIIQVEAVAVEAYRSGTITPAQVQQMLGLGSRWETESFLRRAEAFHDYTMEDLERDIAAIRESPRR